MTCFDEDQSAEVIMSAADFAQMCDEMEAMRAELAELKAPPKVLSADEVTRRGTYKWRLSKTSPWSYTKVIKRYNGDFFMLRLGKRDEEILYGEFSGPIQMPEV